MGEVQAGRVRIGLGDALGGDGTRSMLARQVAAVEGFALVGASVPGAQRIVDARVVANGAEPPRWGQDGAPAWARLDRGQRVRPALEAGRIRAELEVRAPSGERYTMSSDVALEAAPAAEVRCLEDVRQMGVAVCRPVAEAIGAEALAAIYTASWWDETDPDHGSEERFHQVALEAVRAWCGEEDVEGALEADVRDRVDEALGKVRGLEGRQVVIEATDGYVGTVRVRTVAEG